MGYPLGKKGWKVYDLKTKNIFVRCDEVFHEEVFLFANPQDNMKDAIIDFGQQNLVVLDDSLGEAIRLNLPESTSEAAGIFGSP